jgi:hypothetical protein
METSGKNDWLASQSLERSLDIISAINRVSIHSKLQLAGMKDAATSEQLSSARGVLTGFLGVLSELIERAEGTEDKIAFGADPRLSTLARKFLVHPGQNAGSVPYRADDLKELKALLEKRDSVDHEALIKGLAYFRSVLEQHAQADAAIVFNEV